MVRKESRKVTVIIPINPSTLATAQQKGIHVVHGRAMVYTKPHVRAAAKKLRHALSQVRGGFFCRKPDAVKISAQFHFPYQKNAPKSKAANYSLMTERPDIDNLLKGLFDSMSPLKVKDKNGKVIVVDKGWFEDDSQVVIGEAIKIRTPYTPKIVLTVEVMGNDWKAVES